MRRTPRFVAVTRNLPSCMPASLRPFARAAWRPFRPPPLWRLAQRGDLRWELTILAIEVVHKAQLSVHQLRRHISEVDGHRRRQEHVLLWIARRRLRFAPEQPPAEPLGILEA